MPNISFDVFYDKDILNFTATRGKQVPKIKPAWKTRSAPKLAPKEPEAPSFATPVPKADSEIKKKTNNAGIKAPKLNSKPKA